MARLVRHTATGPIRIDPATWPRDEHGNLKPFWACACGLSGQFPMCDGSHKACRGEQAGLVYRYDPATRGVIDSSVDIPDAAPFSADANSTPPAPPGTSAPQAV